MRPIAVVSCCLILPFSVHTGAQTITLTYRYDSNSNLPVEFFAFNFNADSVLRIAASGECVLITPSTGWMEGQAGTDGLNQIAEYKRLDALRIASTVMPQLYLAEASDIQQPRPVGNGTNEFDGSTLAGEFPNGQRLFRREDFPNPSATRMESVEFDLDAEGRLVRIRVPELNVDTRFDLAEDSNSTISYVRTFGDGHWKLQEVQIDPKGDRSIFEPANVVDRARKLAFAAAEAQRSQVQEAASTEEGMREIRHRVSETHDTGISQSTKRFALILTGLIVIAVGSLAWWKNRS